TAVRTLETLEGLPSLALLDSAGTVSIVAGSSERVLQPTLPRIPTQSAANIDSLALGDGSDRMLWDGSSGDYPLLYTPGSEVLDSVGLPKRVGTRSMTVGALTGSARSDILWASGYADWTLLELSIGGEAPALRSIYFDYDTVAIGDLDGNGLDDALAVGEGGLAVMPGDARWGLTCFSQSPFIGGASRVVALGDLDGDGSDEAIVMTDAGGPVIQYDVSWAP
ncbi:MAG: VCBS repeat-containing protein, partial [Nannocystaceae bacterium]|nr:VCBS repeat-containing protein [Nannocystaceae bacterium]